MKVIPAAILAAAISVAAFTAPATAERWHYLIEDRLAEHARLIGEGQRDGTITFFEARRLRSEQTVIRATAYRFRADGRLSDHERVTLRHLQDAAADSIFRARNNETARRRIAWWR